MLKNLLMQSQDLYRPQRFRMLISRPLMRKSILECLLNGLSRVPQIANAHMIQCKSHSASCGEILVTIQTNQISQFQTLAYEKQVCATIACLVTKFSGYRCVKGYTPPTKQVWWRAMIISLRTPQFSFFRNEMCEL